MPLYAQFDHTVAAPSPVIGWYDTDALTYPTIPPDADLLVLTEAQWTDHNNNPSDWAVSAGALITYTRPAPPTNWSAAARSALDVSDTTILRCYENAVVVPSAWATYRATLRSIVAGASVTALPTRPAYPPGT